MKIFSSEYKKDYGTYTFGYANYCVKEEQDQWHEIYQLGFLPYTGDYNITDSIFYMARSVRIDLDHFTPSSENRRLDRKMEEFKVDSDLILLADFDFSEDFYDFVQTYAAQRFQGGEMSRERIDYLRSREEFTHILVYRENTNQEVLGYIFCCIDENMLHYWFSFFDLSLFETYPIGKWLMYRTIALAKEWKKQFVYLGTCYGTKSLYKVRDFKGVQFFDGNEWNSDVKMIKEWSKSDETELEMDRFKEQNRHK